MRISRFLGTLLALLLGVASALADGGARPAPSGWLVPGAAITSLGTGCSVSGGSLVCSGNGGISGPGTTTVGYVPTWAGTNGGSLGTGYAVGTSGGVLGLLNGNLTFSGTDTFTGNVAFGPGGSGNGQISQNGTGTWTFKSGSGANIFQYAPVNPAMNFYVTIDPEPSTTISNCPDARDCTPIATQQTWTGTQGTSLNSNGGLPLGFYFSETANVGGTLSGVMGGGIQLAEGGSSLFGGGITLFITNKFNVTSANTVTGVEYWTLKSNIELSANDNGTSGTHLQTARDAYLGMQVDSTATYWNEVGSFQAASDVASSMDGAGTAPNYHYIGWMMMHQATSGFGGHGIISDIALDFSNQSVNGAGSSGYGWRDAVIGFGDLAGNHFPGNTTVTLIKAFMGSGDTATVGSEIDFSAITAVTGNILNTSGIAVTGAGVIVVGGNASSGNPTITTGAGAPSSTQPNGSVYQRKDGAANTRFYISEGSGTWAPVASN